MAKNMYADFKKKLDRIENHIAEEVAPQANELLKESVRYSLIDWYNDYTPQSYERTYNFMKILDSTKTRGKGNVLRFSVDSGAMDSYVGWFGQSLQPSTAFDYMFMDGEHGHGKWMISIFKEGSTTEFKDLTDYFGEIADIWDEMSQKQQNDFLLKAFGRTQAQAGAALIQNYKGVTKALDEMEQSAGSSDKEMETIEQSLEYRINALKETWVGTIQQMVDRGDLGTIVDGLTKLSEGIGFVTGNLGLLKTAALGIATALSFKNVGECNYIS